MGLTVVGPGVGEVWRCGGVGEGYCERSEVCGDDGGGLVEAGNGW